MAEDLDMDDIPAAGLGAEDADFEEDNLDTPEVGQIKDISGDGGVTKKILVDGTGWEKPEKGDKVTVHYVGTLASNGEKFDSSRDRGDPFVFDLGKGSVIKGWDVGVATMRKGEKAVLTCRADYAYGPQGSPPSIPGGATLDFEVELLSWKSVKDIAGDGGIIKTVHAEGTGWDNPKPADEVMVKYAVRVKGEEKTVAEAEGAEFTLRDGHLLKAFDTTLPKMKKGESATLDVSPAYGFREGEAPAGVPADAHLTVDLQLLSWKKVENVTDDRGVIKKTLRAVDEWNMPNAGATVRVTLTGRLPDGTVFEEHKRGEELEFVVDEDQVVEGLDLAVAKMKEGELALVTVAPQYAFGDKGEQRALATVPPHTTVTYTVELVHLQKGKESWDMSNEEKVAAAAKRKEAGNALFKTGAWARAIKKYKAANDVIGAADDKWDAGVRAESRAVKRSADLNLAAAHLKLGAWKDAAAAASKVLEGDSQNVKALYRRAQAYLGSQDYVEAEQDIRAGLQIEPNNRDLKALMARYKKESAASKKREAALYSTMFQKMAKLKDSAPLPPAAVHTSPAPAAGAENDAAAANELEPKAAAVDGKETAAGHERKGVAVAAAAGADLDMLNAVGAGAANGHGDVNAATAMAVDS